MSSGVVSQRTRITASPARPSSSARFASKTIFPQAAPGDAFRPVAMASISAAGSIIGMEELVELRGVDARHGLLAADQVLADHVHGGLERRCGGALRRPRLQQVEPVVLDRELEVLHVAVVLLEPSRRLQELLVRGSGSRLPIRASGSGVRMPGDDVLALRVEQELADDARPRPSTGRA